MSNLNERGQALILVALAAIGLFALAALAIDGSRVFSDKRHAQNAADTAALAGALAHTRNSDIAQAAQSRAASNGYDNGSSNDVSVTIVNSPAGACPATGKDIAVTIVSYVPTTFARVIGRSEVTVAVTSTARSCDIAAISGPPLYPGSAVFATKTGSCNNGKAINITGSGTDVQIWGGDLGSASTDGSCLFFGNGSQNQLKKQESGTACADIVTAASSGGTFSSIQGQDGCGNKYYNQTFAPPPADLGITCSGNAIQNGNSLGPGNWTGSFPPPGVSMLQAGTYCVKGNFSLSKNQSLSGTGVTIVMGPGYSLSWNAESQASLSAPTSGPYKGLLIYYPPGNANNLTIGGNSNAKLTGTILAQSSNCLITGNGTQLQKQALQFVCYTWSTTTGGQIELTYDASKFFGPVTVVGPTISVLY